MKTIYTKVSLFLTPIVAAVIVTSCMSGNSGAGAETEPINVTTPNDVRTSSDMNISPSNLTTSDPALKMQEDTLKTTPVSPQ